MRGTGVTSRPRQRATTCRARTRRNRDTKVQSRPFKKCSLFVSIAERYFQFNFYLDVQSRVTCIYLKFKRLLLKD